VELCFLFGLESGFPCSLAVLDADPAILDYIRGILADRFSVSLFTQAAELTRSLRESPAPDLLLMDWHIAEDETEENALGLLAKIHASKPALPIIMLCLFRRVEGSGGGIASAPRT
jgi:DNA-binding NtrC family response regulator